MSIYKTNVTKEDFKRAFTSCGKEAWIMHSKENFLKAHQLLEDKVFQYNIDNDPEDEDNYSSDSSAINVFEAFKEVFESENNKEALERWEKSWEDPQGFEVETYAGDAIEDGDAVGEKARELFDTKLSEMHNDNLESFDLSHLKFQDALKRTDEIVKQNRTNFKYKYLYEPAFEFDSNNLRTRCDILEFVDDKHVIIYEVKATSKVKKEHFFDVAYQRFVLEQNGFIVDNMFIVHMEADYVYGMKNYFDIKQAAKDEEQAFDIDMTYDEVIDYVKENNLLEPFTNVADDDLDLDMLFNIDAYSYGEDAKRPTLMEMYSSLTKSHDMNLLITELSKQLAIDPKDDKAVRAFLGQRYCPDLMNYVKKDKQWVYVEQDCYHVLPYYDKSIENIFNFTGLHKDKKAFLFNETGLVYLKDIDDLDKDFPLNTSGKESKSYFSHANKRHFEVYKEFLKTGKVTSEMIIDTNNLSRIREILKDYHEDKNVYMFDFETAKWALPKFNLSKSYQQIPFQYSIDVINDDKYDYNRPDTMEHHDFIGSERIDPRPNFIVSFIKDILMTHGEGVYVAYNKSFERTCLKYLAVEFPKYKVPLLYVATHTIDLMDFFKGVKDRDLPFFLIYHPEFHGSYSIKKTQPALDPNFSYKDLTINKGDKAAQIFREYIEGKINDDQWFNTVKPNMIKYCNRDTLAMVVILQQVEKHLKEVDKDILNRKTGD